MAALLLSVALFAWSTAHAQPSRPGARYDTLRFERPSPPPCPDWVEAKCLAALQEHVGPLTAGRWFAPDSGSCGPVTIGGAQWNLCPALLRRVLILRDSIPKDRVLGWRFAFRRTIPGKPWADGVAQVFVDTLGVPYGFTGVDSCAKFPERCRLAIDSTGAREAAARAGLEPGVAPWEIGFHWDFRRERFVWEVKNTLENVPANEEGRFLVLDANTGVVVESLGWQSIRFK